MKRNHKVTLGLAGLLFVLGSRGNADSLIPEGPQVQTYAGIPHPSGGIGLDEREALRFLAKEYNLQLSFALKKGNYLSDPVARLILPTYADRLQKQLPGPVQQVWHERTLVARDSLRHLFEEASKTSRRL